MIQMDLDGYIFLFSMIINAPQFIFMETSERPDLNHALESLHKEFKVAPVLLIFIFLSRNSLRLVARAHKHLALMASS